MDAQQSTNHTDTGQDGPPSDGGDLQSDSRVETPPDWAPAHVDISVASIARIYDYFLGGKDNYPADREVGRQVVELLPWLPATARANRRFLVRAVSVLAKAGIGQFLDQQTFVVVP